MNLKYRIYLLVIVFGLSTNISNSQTPDVIKGEILVHIKKKTTAESLVTDFNKTAKSPQLKLKRCVSKSMNIWLLEYDFKNLDGDKLLGKLDANNQVQTAQFNHKTEYRSTSREPNDSLFSLQWQYVNRGSGGGIDDADIDVDSAWSITTGGVTAAGDTIVVAIVDDGVDYDHPDMIDNLWVNRNEIPNNSIDDDENGYIDDYRGWNVYNNDDDIENDTFWGEGGDHGTPVAGIVGAKGNNSIGVAGISWNVKLMIIPGSGNEANAVASYSYIMEMRKMYNETAGKKGAFVVATNSSWGTNYGQPSDAPIWCAMYDSLGKYGVLSA
ncbi:MAG: S8 family serine peptidase, partial [Bacteroidia bacterium]|nr:S8 family serine peptidase [Bacteroidia bacterium]